jgi:hypothetical protein
MDRIIEVKVGGNYLCKDNKNAGVRGEGNVTVLRIAFDESWDNYAKTITFWDARGKNPVMIMLTKNRLENIVDNSRVYLVPIPPEPLVEAGEMTFVIDGYKGNFEKDGEGNYVIVYDGTNKRQRSMSDRLVVKDAPMADDAGEPTDPTPTPSEQLQAQIDKLTDDIRGAYVARDEAMESAETANSAKDIAVESAEKAENAVGKTSYIGDNGNWYAWGVEGFYDTGIKAQAGSTVYVGENPPDEADVWINPKGELLVYVTIEELRAILAELTNVVTPTPATITLYANRWVQGESATLWYQVLDMKVPAMSKVDLQPNPEQLCIFHEKDLAFVAENDEGTVTVFCIGQKPANDYEIQATITEVTTNG